MEEIETNNLGQDLDEQGNFKPAGFIREFSSETNKESRDELAQRIMGVRRSKQQEKQEKSEKIDLHEQKIAELREKIAKIDEKFWASLPLLDKLAANLNAGNKQEVEKLQKELEALRAQGSVLPDPRQMLEQFYQNEEKRWQDSGFTKEDVDRYFSEENLSSLNLEDYLLLMSRFNTDFATHVTRQGIRDHIGMMEHIAGQGEFWHGFEDILEDGRLKAVYSNILMQEDKEQALAEYFQWYAGQINKLGYNFEQKTDRQLIEQYLKEENRKGASAGTYTDRVAVHLGVKAVLDSYYGGEQNNEFFFLVPMAHIAKEYHMAQLGPADVDKNNNLWVWDQEHKGVSIIASIACIPENTPVDPRNGSSYELDENNQPIINQQRIETLAELSQNKDFIDFLHSSADEIYQAYLKSNAYETIHKYTNILAEKFGINDPELANFLLSQDQGYARQRLESNYLYKSPYEQTPQDFAKELLAQDACLFLRAKNTVPSKEYWEKYFVDHPELKPSKIYYYRSSPNRAVKELRYKYRLDKYTSVEKAETLFPEKIIRDGEADEANAGFDEFFALAQKVLDKNFPE